KSTKFAGTNRLARVRDSARDLLRLIAPCSHHPERDPFRRARTYSWHLSQLRNQIPDCDRIFRPSQSALSLLPTVILLTAEQAVPAGANRIAMQDRLPLRVRAPSEIQNTLPPNVFLDTEPHPPKKNPCEPHAPVWPPWRAKVVRRLLFDHANSFRSQNQLGG